MNSTTNRPTDAQLNAALLSIRIASTLAFLYHGSAILFGAFGGPGPEKFAAFIHAPTIVGYLVGLTQLFGGVTILTGILTRLGALCGLVNMVGAIFTVHLPNGFDVAKHGYEYALAQALICLALLLTGPGGYSLNSRLPEQLRKF
jgi:putative oxidoreductase